MDFFSVPRGDCRFLEQNDTRLKGYVEIGVDAEAYKKKTSLKLIPHVTCTIKGTLSFC